MGPGDPQGIAYLQIDGVIVVLPNFGDELGRLSVCNNLYQYGIPFTNTTYHTYPIDSAEFHRDLDFFMRVCRMIKGHLGRRSLRRDQACLGQGEMTDDPVGNFQGRSAAGGFSVAERQGIGHGDRSYQ